MYGVLEAAQIFQIREIIDVDLNEKLTKAKESNGDVQKEREVDFRQIRGF